MSYLEVAKLHPKLGKILEVEAEMSAKAAIEFATTHDVKVEDITSMKVGGYLLLGMHRYIDRVTALETNKNIQKDAIFKRVDAGGVESEWVYIPNAIDSKVFLHLFGGGYIIGNLDSRRWPAYLFSRAANIRCLNVGYRLAPEHPYPAALEDSITAYRWLLTQNIAPNNIIICGESAGGGLTMALMLKLRELELPMPGAAIMLSPWVDLINAGESFKKFYKYEPVLASLLKIIAVLYSGTKNKKDPYISPIYADFEDLPPLLIQAGGIEVIRDQAILLAERTKSSGVEVTLEVYERMTHVFQKYDKKLDESMNAWKSIGNFVKKNIA